MGAFLDCRKTCLYRPDGTLTVQTVQSQARELRMSAEAHALVARLAKDSTQNRRRTPASVEEAFLPPANSYLKLMVTALAWQATTCQV